MGMNNSTITDMPVGWKPPTLLDAETTISYARHLLRDCLPVLEELVRNVDAQKWDFADAHDVHLLIKKIQEIALPCPDCASGKTPVMLDANGVMVCEGGIMSHAAKDSYWPCPRYSRK